MNDYDKPRPVAAAAAAAAKAVEQQRKKRKHLLPKKQDPRKIRAIRFAKTTYYQIKKPSKIKLTLRDRMKNQMKITKPINEKIQF